MSQKVEKPVLQGQRIKTRKRDEKEKYDPSSFRDAIFEGFAKAENLEQVFEIPRCYRFQTRLQALRGDAV